MPEKRFPVMYLVIVGVGSFATALIAIFTILQFSQPAQEFILGDVFGQLSLLSDETADLREQKVALESDIRQLRNEIQDKDAEIENNQHLIDDLNETIENLSEENPNLQNTINELRDTISGLRSDKTNLDIQIRTLEAQVVTLQEDKAEIEEQLEACRNSCPVVNGSPTPRPSPTPPGGRLFFDDFTNGPSSDWARISGDWEAIGGGYGIDSFSSGNFYSLVRTGLNWENYAVDVDVTLNSDNDFGIVLRAVDDSNMAMFFYDASRDSFCLTPVQGRDSTRCDLVSRKMPSRFHIRFEVIGEKIVAAIEGIKIGELTGGFPDHGMPGLYLGESPDDVIFDNFEVSEITSFSF